MKAVGRHGDWESRTEAKVPAPAQIATRLGIAEGELCVRTAYEFLADGRPVQLSTSWEPYDLSGAGDGRLFQPGRRPHEMAAQSHEACPDPRVEPGQQWVPLIGSPHGGGSGGP